MTTEVEQKMVTNGLDLRFFQALPAPAFVVDPKGKVICWNDSMEEITGKSFASMKNKKSWTAFFNKKRKTPVEFSQRSEELEEDENFEFVNLLSGEKHKVFFSANPILDEEEELVAISATLSTGGGGSSTDNFADMLPTPVIAVDKNFTVTYINPAGAELVGLTPKSAIGQKCHDLFKTAHCRTQNCRCTQAMQQDGVFTGETVADPYGLNIPIQYTATPIKDENGNIIGAVEYIIDITEQKKLIQAADEKVDYLNRIPTPIMAIDRDFNITYMNPVGANVVGMTPEGVIGQKCYDLFKTTHCRTQECCCNKAMQQDGIFTAETLADPHGLNLPIEYTGTPLKDEDGNITGALEYILDITERKAMLKDIINVTTSIADKNLKERTTGQYEGDFQIIADGLNTGVQGLHDTVAQIKDTVNEIASATSQIAGSSQSVAQGSSEQAASVEETSASLEEISGMTKQNADNTQQAKVLADQAHNAAGNGTSAMSEMSDAMTKIRESAEGTAAIISDINEIAFQTNLLALNAAVEAARAGDAGRGFAVVAEEVRNLAQRSKEAAKKTEALIKTSVKLSENGERISHNVNLNLMEIVSVVEKVTSIIDEIAAASNEQAKGIDTVNDAVAQMDKVTQQNAANAEQSSSAAEELAGQSGALASLLGVFQLDHTSNDTFHSMKPYEPPPHEVPNNSTPYQLKPEDLIPMGDDPDFAEF